MRLSVNKVCGHRRKKVHSFLVMDEGPGPYGPWAHWALGPYGPWAHMGPGHIWAQIRSDIGNLQIRPDLKVKN